jgi:hypothetical protein
MFVLNRLGRSLILVDLNVLLRGKQVCSSVNSRDSALIIGIHSTIYRTRYSVPNLVKLL